MQKAANELRARPRPRYRLKRRHVGVAVKSEKQSVSRIWVANDIADQTLAIGGGIVDAQRVVDLGIWRSLRLEGDSILE